MGKENTFSISEAIADTLKRPDVSVVGQFEGLKFPYLKKPEQDVAYINYVIAPVRPIFEIKDFERFVGTIAMNIPDAAKKQPSIRNGFFEFGSVYVSDSLGNQLDPESQKVLEKIEYTEISIYPNEYLARVVAEYKKAKERGFIQSTWNKIELASHAVPVELIGSKKKAKQFAEKLYEENFFQLLRRRP